MWSTVLATLHYPYCLVRNHVVHVSDSKMITIAGGKWTTYRAMAAETVDKALEVKYNIFAFNFLLVRQGNPQNFWRGGKGLAGKKKKNPRRKLKI